jgi:serine/threonine protein kinase/tetratricopeptide (TPR) repeat protein
MIGQKISHYRILEKIGEGGMSAVYKAEDTMLRRYVALKFPSEQVLADEAKKARFIHEARASAALDHPNICTLHEIAESGGKTFISMAYIDGQNLYEKVKNGPISVDEAVDISIQTAQGLSKAHEKGIVHRDIKSGNIMVTHSGQVKIMDFGLAKLTGETKETRLTQQGAIMGTVDYMSPEQAKGEPVDYRTDIWSLGVVMYEMLTGELPFKGGNAQAVIHSILYEEPKSLSDSGRYIPVALKQIVLRMMQKKVSNRHENMGVVISELTSVKRDSATILTSREKTPSIVVLPFVNMSADKEQEYFCDGMAEELINALTHIKDLHVIARTSAFSYKGRDVNVCDIGRELSVETVLEGSVRKAGNRLRITAQLVETTSGHHLWSERYDRQIGDVFAIQDEITLAIVDTLKPTLLGEQKARLIKRKPVNLEAYNLYLRGLFFWHKRGETYLKKAIQCFEQAIEKELYYALAYAGLASSYSLLPIYSSLPPKEYVQKGKEAALTALQIDETLPEARASLGFINLWYDWDWASAESQFKQAIELNPGYASAYHWFSYSLLFRGRFNEAVKKIEKALELDPLSSVINKDHGTVYYYAGQLDRTIESSKRSLEMDPSMLYAHYHIGLVYFKQSMYEEALVEFKKEAELARAPGLAEPMIALTYVQIGKKDEAENVLEYVVKQSKQKYVSPFILACLHIVLGKNDEGFKLLDKAYDGQDPWLSVVKTLPGLYDVRSDSRYIALLKKMNLDK